MVWKIFHSESTINPDDLFILNPPSSTRGHKYKIFKTRFNTDARSRFFSQRIINRWNILPVEVVEAISLKQFKSYLANQIHDVLFSPHPSG